MNVAIYTFIQYRISALVMVLYFMFFIPHRYSKKKTWILVVGAYLLGSTLNLVVLLGDLPFDTNIIFVVTQIYLIQLLALLIGKYRDWRTLFVSISAITFVLPGNLLSSFIYSETLSIGISITLQIMIHYIVFLFLYARLREPLQDEMKNGTGMWRAMCAFPALIYLTIYSIATYPSSIYKVKSNFFGVFMVLMLLIVAYVLVIKMLAKEKEIRRENMNSEMMETYVKSLKKEVEMLQISQEKSAILRHDFRHKVRIMSSLLENGEVEKLNSMFQMMNREIGEAKKVDYTKNPALNGVMTYSEETARKYGVEFECDLAIPKDFSCNEFELATVMSNLLDNAITACKEMQEKEEKWIRVHGHVTKGQMIFEIANTFSGEVQFDEYEGKIQSTHGEGHGFGMKSVELFAEHTGAVFDYTIENQVFYARLLVDL